MQVAQIDMAEQQTIAQQCPSFSVDPSVSVCDSKLSLSDIFSLIFVIFCCFHIVKHLDVSHCICHKAKTLSTSLLPVNSLKIKL